MRTLTLLLCASFVPSLLLGQASTTQWQGSSSAWRSAPNWKAGVPSSTVGALISSSYPAVIDAHAPVLAGTDTARTFGLKIQSGGVLRFEPDGVLVVHGTDKVQNNGTIFLGSGLLIFRDKATLHNGGVFNADSGRIRVSGGSWEKKSGATFNAGSSLVEFQASVDQSIVDSTQIFSFFNLNLLTQGTITVFGSVTVLNDCYLAAGCTLNIPVGSSFVVNGSFAGDGVITGGGSYTPLPVQLVAFSASAEGARALLQWTTAAEVNNYGFEIERRGVRSSQQGEWTLIGFVRGNGTTTSASSYSFVDQDLSPGRYAYRIRQIDFDGSSAYYHAAEIELAGIAADFFLGSNYPNPFNPSTTIEFTVPENGRAILAVFNMIGEKVATLFDGEAEAGRAYLTSFQAANLPSGLYFSRLEFGNRTLIKKMVLLK